MSLKQLRLNKQLQVTRNSLDELLKRETGLRTRETELELAIREVETEEDLKIVEDEVSTLEGELENLETEKKELESKIEEIEKDLDELEDKKPENTEEGTERNNQKQGGLNVRVNRGFFKGMTRSEVNPIIEREEVKTWLDNIRNEKLTENRGVKGGELGIPDVILGIIRDNLHKYSKLIRKVNLRSVAGTSRMNVVGDIPEAIWTEACATLNELEIYFNQVEMDGYKVGGYVAICNATRDDSDFNLANEILLSIGISIGLAVDKAILYGTGKKMPLGIVTRLIQTAKPENWGINAPEWKNLSSLNIIKINETTPKKLFAEMIRASGKAKANYGIESKFWAMNEITFTELQATLVEFNAAGAIVSSMNNTMPIINGEIIILPFMSDGDIVGGYGSQYLLGERAGSTFAMSEHVQFIQDNTVYKGTARYDGIPIMGDGFVAMNILNKEVTKEMNFAPDEANKEEVEPEGIK